MASSSTFAEEVAKDTRSYSNELFFEYLKWDKKQNPLRPREDQILFSTLFKTVRTVLTDMQMNDVTEF